MGAALGPSAMCSLDIDCLESFRTICECYGIDLDALLKTTPTIQGASKGMRLMFRVPAGADLPYHKLNWKREDEPAKSYTVFELRAATDGKQRQDVLPPSIHPDTGKPYRWLTQPTDNWPEPPRWLLAMWQDFDTFKPQMQAMCPWLPAPEMPTRQTPASDTGPRNPAASVIDEYCRANPLQSELSRYGYKQVGKRWLSPHSTTGLPGVIEFPDGQSCWVHHASDPLCSEDSGKPVNSFDLFCYYDHGNDASKAVKVAAELLGMKPEPRARLVEQVRKTEVIEQSPAIAEADAPVAAFTPGQRSGYNLAEPLKFTTDKGKPLKHI
jgi:putative DNA primase/helicase